jgi:hypothetical protein
MTPPSKLGAEYLTFVLWTVTPEGHTGNAGEILINKDGVGKLSATTPAQTFSMIVTAEPYFALRVPSERTPSSVARPGGDELLHFRARQQMWTPKCLRGKHYSGKLLTVSIR